MMMMKGVDKNEARGKTMHYAKAVELGQTKKCLL